VYTVQAARRWLRRRGQFRAVHCTGSQKVVEESMHPIPEAGGAYMELYTVQAWQPEGGGGVNVS
jgi:hypothetical protein